MELSELTTDESIAPQPHQVFLPGCFVVLQGISGDGLANTIESGPDYSCLGNSEEDGGENVGGSKCPREAGVDEIKEAPPLQEDHFDPNRIVSSLDQRQPHLFPATSSGTNPSLLISLASNLGPTFALNNPAIRQVPNSTARAPLQTVSEVHSEASPPTPARHDDAFVVVDSEESNADSPPIAGANPLAGSTLSPNQEQWKKKAVLEWKHDLAQRHRLQRQEWQLQQQQMNTQRASSSSILEQSTDWWLDPATGHLAVFDSLPQNQKRIGSLSPGTTVTAQKMYTLDSETLQLIQVDEEQGNEDKPAIPPSIGVVQVLEIQWSNSEPSALQDPNLIISEQPAVGYCVYSVHGYAFLVPGMASLYMNPHVWWWRVTCKVGAVLRTGLELSSGQLCTIPYGSFVQVTRKTVNQTGLSRLRVVARVDNRQVEGWCSEFLNPLSGQRGHVVQPVPFMAPALYRVTLPQGAVIREEVELSSRHIGNAPFGTIVTGVRRQFSEHPQDQCLERLKLAGGSGWISVRLNKAQPQDHCIVELVGVDPRFHPHQPDDFHWQCFAAEHARQQEQTQQPNPNGAEDLSSVEESSTSDEKPKARAGTGETNNRKRRPVEACLICLTEERNATIVHGETGHIACCLVCARILNARGDRCPVCRLEIDFVIQHFWA